MGQNIFFILELYALVKTVEVNLLFYAKPLKKNSIIVSVCAQGIFVSVCAAGK
jgi:hypothetical protein